MNDISIDQFLKIRKDYPIIDVRSPEEFQKGHIKESVNIPLFSNEERKVIGLTYKELGRDKAIKLGESFGNPKIPQYLKSVESLFNQKELIVLCFRGGMRSQRFSALLEKQGYTINRLEKGYKSFRKNVNREFSRNYQYQILGGKTGCGKTDILQYLSTMNQQVIDLEALSNHRGSAFGAIGKGEQPTTEQFENDLFEELFKRKIDKCIWLEDESMNIGRVYIPGEFFQKMKTSPLIILNMDSKLRIKQLCEDYSKEGQLPLIESIKKIQKKLGLERAQLAIEAVEKDQYPIAASIILDYYDKCYSFGISNKTNEKIEYLDVTENDSKKVAEKLLLLKKG